MYIATVTSSLYQCIIHGLLILVVPYTGDYESFTKQYLHMPANAVGASTVHFA